MACSWAFWPGSKGTSWCSYDVFLMAVWCIGFVTEQPVKGLCLARPAWLVKSFCFPCRMCLRQRHMQRWSAGRWELWLLPRVEGPYLPRKYVSVNIAFFTSVSWARWPQSQVLFPKAYQTVLAHCCTQVAFVMWLPQQHVSSQMSKIRIEKSTSPVFISTEMWGTSRTASWPGGEREGSS